jgi:carbamoyltransferase
MYVLGISCFYHDSSAALIKDGILIAAAQEERFTRKKHDTSFPVKSIEFCLAKAGIKVDDIDYVAFYEKPLLKFERLIYQHLDYFPKSWKVFVNSIPSWVNEKLQVRKILKKKINYRKDILFVEHHLAHAASFLVSPFDKAAILTVDGVGEWTTTAYGLGKGNQISLVKEINFPHSLGLLYSAITAHLGFSVNNSEYKVMGLAAYGSMNKKTNKFYKLLRENVIDLKSDGSYKLNQDYFRYSYSNRMPSQKLIDLLNLPIRTPESEITQDHKDLAAAVQLITEEAMVKILNHVYKETKSPNVVISGGVGLNSVFNGRILGNTPFKKVWLQPDPGDGGTSVGAAFYVYNSIMKKKRKYVMNSPYLGPEYSDQEIKKFLDENNIKYESFNSEKEMIDKTANLINENNVVGWFQTGMEWGPRALGARSILSNPCNSRMQEILNLKVKHREKFRPFAPAVCKDDAPKYFETDSPVPSPTDFMLMVYPIKQKYRKIIPAVTHVDGSGRLQTVERSQNRKYYDLIKKFGSLSGVPIIINTSFNIRGEPIVCTPFDAYKCMMGTGIDYLVLGNFIVKREDNPQDMWDSEKNALD